MLKEKKSLPCPKFYIQQNYPPNNEENLDWLKIQKLTEFIISWSKVKEMLPEVFQTKENDTK